MEKVERAKENGERKEERLEKAKIKKQNTLDNYLEKQVLNKFLTLPVKERIRMNQEEQKQRMKKKYRKSIEESK